jgi:hypothetical protein
MSSKTPCSPIILSWFGCEDTRVVAADTRLCSLQTSLCRDVTPGRGGAEAFALTGSEAVVPGWSLNGGAAETLTTIGRHGRENQLQLALTPDLGGPIALAPDGRYFYWLTTLSSQSSDKNPEQELLMLDLHSGLVVRSVALGNESSGSVTVGPDGRVYVPVMFSNAQTREPGQVVRVYSPTLEPQGAIAVGSTPWLVSVSPGGEVAVVDGNGDWVDFFGPDGRPTGFGVAATPQVVGVTWGATRGCPVAALITTSSEPGGPTGNFGLGVLCMATRQMSWRSFAGTALSPIALAG